MRTSFRLTLCLFLFALPGAVGFAQTPVFTSPLPTGVRLDAVGEAVELGSMPLNVVPALSGDKAVVVLSGWREQGIQVVDLKTRKVTQTLLQDGAFYGAAFSPDGARSTSPAATPTCSSSTPGKMARRRSRTSSNWPRQRRPTVRARAIRRESRSRPMENSFMSRRTSAIGLRS